MVTHIKRFRLAVAHDSVRRLPCAAAFKVMMAAHSWGENVARNFLAWADVLEEGWTERHIAVYFNIAGATLGVPKVHPPFLPLLQLIHATPHPYYP